jgi:hypothetical protein
MTQHELLAFIDRLHAFIERSVSNRGPWCWPTRELLVENLADNKTLWGPSWDSGFRQTLRSLRHHDWAVEEGCSPHCHARHVRLTSAGLEMLRLMNEHGCATHRTRPHGSGCHAQFKLHRNLAA